MKNKIRNISLLAIFLLIITACGAKNEDAKSKEEAKGKIEIEDVLGRKVQLDKPLDKVIIQGSGSGGPFMTMMYLDKDNF